MSLKFKIALPVMSLAVLILVVGLFVAPFSPFAPNKEVAQDCSSLECFLKQAKAAYEQVQGIPDGMVRYQKITSISRGMLDYYEFGTDMNKIIDIDPNKGVTMVEESWSKNDGTNITKITVDYFTKEFITLVISQNGYDLYYVSQDLLDQRKISREIDKQKGPGFQVEEPKNTLDNLPKTSPSPSSQTEELANCIDKHDIEWLTSEGYKKYHARELRDAMVYGSLDKQTFENLLAQKDLEPQDMGEVFVSEFSKKLRGIQYIDSQEQSEEHSEKQEYFFDPQTFGLKKTNYYSSSKNSWEPNGNTYTQYMTLFNEDKLISQTDASVKDIFNPKIQNLDFDTWQVHSSWVDEYYNDLLSGTKTAPMSKLGCYRFNEGTKQYDLIPKEEAKEYIARVKGGDDLYQQQLLEEMYPEK